MSKEDFKNIVPFPRRKRAKALSPKVTSEMAAQMRSMYAQGMAQHEIAAHFQVNQGRVSDAVNFKC